MNMAILGSSILKSREAHLSLFGFGGPCTEEGEKPPNLRLAHCTENNTTMMFLDSSNQVDMKYLKTIVKVFILIVVVTLGTTLNTVHAQAPNLTAGQLYSIKMNQWLDRLETAESQNNTMMVILDTNDRYSYGCLQFQMDTFLTYSKEYGITGEMMDCGIQKELATKMIQGDYSAWSNWYNSVKYRGAGYPPKES